MMYKTKKSLIDWSLHTSNHGLPKLVSSKNKLIVLLWTIIFLGSIYYCVSAILFDIYFYNKFKTNTKVNIVNSIGVELPTISICADLRVRNDSNFSLILSDCEIDRGRYWEVEKCDEESFYRHPNGECLTFNGSLHGGLQVESDGGLKFKFRSDGTDSSGIFVIIHLIDSMPLSPSDVNDYIELFGCAGNMNARSEIKYIMKDRRHKTKLAYPYNDCVYDWSTISELILNNLPDDLRKEYDEEVCFDLCSYVLQKNNAKCDSMCPFKCDSRSNKVGYTRYCEENEEENEESTVYVSLRETWYTSIEDVEAMTLGQLLGSIGGRLSIALGMSLISFIDFIEGAVLFFHSIFKSKRTVEDRETPAQQQPHSSTSDEDSVPELKHELTKWTLNSNIHGCPNICKSKYFTLRIVWFLCIVGSLIYCVIILKNNITIYYSHDVRTKYSVEVEDKTYYPALTFCSDDLDLDLRNDEIFIEKHCYGPGEERVFKSEDFVVKDYFGVFTCYSLNVHKNDTDTDLVSVVADGGTDECRFHILLESNFLVFYIHNQTEIPFKGYEVMAKTGLEYSFGLSRTYNRLLPKPYGNCAHDWNSIDTGLLEFIKKHADYDYHNYEYNQEACIELCGYKTVTELCNVTLEGKMYENIDELYLDSCVATNEESMEMFVACEQQCPLKCDRMIFEFNQARTKIAANEIVFCVYYEETSYYTIANEPILTADELFASIGGQLGLCIGMSMLSIIDLLFLLFALIIAAFNKRKRAC